MEDLYCELKSDLLDLIEAKTSSANNHENQHSGEKAVIDLPKIKLEIFDGKYEDWFQFYDLFQAAIKKRKGLSDAQKFYYLRNHLKGEPLLAISQLKIEDSSLKIALDRLEKGMQIRVLS